MNVLPLFKQSAGKVSITNNSNRKTCWLSGSEYQKHNECPLSPGMALISRHGPSKASLWQGGDVWSWHGWDCVISADNQCISTPGYRAVSSSLHYSPFVSEKLNVINSLQTSPMCLPATDPKSAVRDTSQWPKNTQSKFDLHIRIFILEPYMHYHQIWLNVWFVKKKTFPFKVFRQPWSVADNYQPFLLKNEATKNILYVVHWVCGRVLPSHQVSEVNWLTPQALSALRTTTRDGVRAGSPPVWVLPAECLDTWPKHQEHSTELLSWV